MATTMVPKRFKRIYRRLTKRFKRIYRRLTKRFKRTTDRSSERFKRTYRRAKRFLQRLSGRLARYLFGLDVALYKMLGYKQFIKLIAMGLIGIGEVTLKVPSIPTPLICRTSGSDVLVLWGVFYLDRFNVDVPGLEASTTKLIIDGGANVGYSSVYFANRYPKAKIIAIEPDASNCAQFQKNCRNYPNIELVRGALWEEPTDSLVIANPADPSWGFRVREDCMASVDREDNCFGGLTIEDVLDLSGEREADLLKLNIEGAEEALFAARSCERWIDRVGAIVVEPHDLKTLEVITTRVSDSGFVLADSKETLSPFVLFVRAQPN